MAKKRANVTGKMGELKSKIITSTQQSQELLQLRKLLQMLQNQLQQTMMDSSHEIGVLSTRLSTLARLWAASIHQQGGSVTLPDNLVVRIPEVVSIIRNRDKDGTCAKYELKTELIPEGETTVETATEEEPTESEERPTPQLVNAMGLPIASSKPAE